jgi:hypothetical protein
VKPQVDAFISLFLNLQSKFNLITLKEKMVL